MTSSDLFSFGIDLMRSQLAQVQQEPDTIKTMQDREADYKARLARMGKASEAYEARMAFADVEAEQVSEGRMHVNTRPNRKDN